MPMHSALSAEQANGRAHQRDDEVFQQDRDSLNAVRLYLLSGWCWVQLHTGDQEGFARPPELVRPEIYTSWENGH